MSLLLASVSSLDEALLAHRLNVDIIDLKQPARGALGALDMQEIEAIIDALPVDARISATLGDLPMQRQELCQAALMTAATGVNFIKVGFFPGGDWQDCINGLGDIASKGYDLIAVLFADNLPDLNILPTLKAASFTGVMLDTMDKQRGSLTQLLSPAILADFVQQAKIHGLFCGLAGSLTDEDIAKLLPLQVDYLGFRTALCQEGIRTAALDEQKILRIKDLLRAG